MTPHKEYCKKHMREYYYFCPECAKDKVVKHYENLAKKKEKEEMNRKFQKLLDDAFGTKE